MSFWDRFKQPETPPHEVFDQKWVPGPVPDPTDHYGKAPRPDQLLYCPSCHEMQPWFFDDACSRCLAEGPPEQDPAASLTGPELHVLEALASGLDLRGVARVTHQPIAKIEAMLEGRDSPRFRRTWQMLLESNGVTLAKLAQRAAEALDAVDQKWHPEEKDFIAIPDNKTRLNATKWLTTQHELDPAPATTAAANVNTGIQVVFNTNLGDEATKQTGNADYTFDVTPLESQEDA
jgi:hypothetical protein